MGKKRRVSEIEEFVILSSEGREESMGINPLGDYNHIDNCGY
jgi:hypothetical protein